jgi:peptidylprolyl isomerase
VTVASLQSIPKVIHVSRRNRRVLPVLLSAVLALGLTACGDDEGGGGDSNDPLTQVTISGDQGKAPEVTWDGEFDADETTSETLVEGDGEEVAAGDKVVVHIWIGNGFSKEQAFSTYEEGGPQTLTVDDKTLSEVFLEGVEGHTIGSRVAVAASAEDAFGEMGNPELGIGNKDSILVIVDLMEMYQEPEPVDVPKSEQPTVVEEKGKPTALDFSGLAKPKADGDLLRTVLKEGDGETLEPDSTITANYLGMVYGAKKPFDESYSKAPAEFSLQQVVPGWTYGLSGVKVGSRVLLTIPPDLGYGAQEQAGIPANSTLYFVVDVISAK